MRVLRETRSLFWFLSNKGSFHNHFRSSFLPKLAWNYVEKSRATVKMIISGYYIRLHLRKSNSNNRQTQQTPNLANSREKENNETMLSGSRERYRWVSSALTLNFVPWCLLRVESFHCNELFSSKETLHWPDNKRLFTATFLNRSIFHKEQTSKPSKHQKIAFRSNFAFLLFKVLREVQPRADLQ